MKYRYLEGIAISDCAFEAFGKNEKELLENAASAVFGEMAKTKKVPLKLKRKIVVSGEGLEMRLYNFLAEIILLKDTENMVFGKIVVKIGAEKNNSGLKGKKLLAKGKKERKATAFLWGEKVAKLNDKIIRRDVKAVTFHKFKVEKTKNGWKAMVVLDI